MISKAHCRRLVLIALCCIGGALRIYNINVNSLWCDEMQQAMNALSDWEHFFEAMARYNSAPPLDNTLTKAVILCFGRADWILRMPAFVFGVASIAAFYFFSRSIADRKTSLIAAALLALSPLAICYSQEVRMYSLFLLLSLASFTCVVRLARHSTLANSLLLGACNGLLILAHYYSILVIGYETIFLFSAGLLGSEKKRSAELLAVCLLIPFFAFLPFIPLLLLQLNKYENGELSYALAANSQFFKAVFLCFSTYAAVPDVWYFLYVTVFFAGLALAWRNKERGPLLAGLVLLAILLSLFCLSFFKKTVTPRNIIFLLPFFLLVCAYAIARALSLLKLNVPQSAAACILIFLWPAFLYHRALPEGHKQPWKQACRYIQEHSCGNEKIFVPDPIDRGHLAYYADPEATYAVGKQDWPVFRNEEYYKIWVIDAAVMAAMEQKKITGWVVSPSFLMQRPYSETFSGNYRLVLARLLGPPVMQLDTRTGPLQIFHVKAER